MYFKINCFLFSYVKFWTLNGISIYDDFIKYKIVAKIKKLNVKVKEVQVTINPIDVNNVIGHKKENAIKLKELYDVDLIVEQDESIKQGKSKIEVTKTYND